MHSCLKLILMACLIFCHLLAVSGVAIAQSSADARWLGTITTASPAAELYAQYDPDASIPGDFSPADSSVDVEPPLIEHEVVSQAEANIRQTFVATVVDDEELAQVVLFYRFNGETSFSRYQMMRVSYSSTYIAQIPTDPKELAPMEYYIQASDTSGNRTVRGYTFSPLVRQIVANNLAAADQSTSSSDATDSVSKAGKLPKAVYIVGGVLLLGLIASAAGSSDSPTPGGGDDCGAAGCRLTITVTSPLE